MHAYKDSKQFIEWCVCESGSERDRVQVSQRVAVLLPAHSALRPLPVNRLSIYVN